MKRSTPKHTDVRTANDELKDPDYELFFLGISAMSVVNVLIALVARDDDIRHIARITDGGLVVLYLIDFVFRLTTAPRKSMYLTRQFGWADLLAAVPLPGFQLFRIVRSVRTAMLLRRVNRRALGDVFRRNQARTTLLTVFLLIGVLIEFGSVGVTLAERGHPEANIVNAGDALWWSYVTISTVGFGDRYPVTIPGRVVGVVMLTAGVGLFSVLTAFLANMFLAPRRRRIQAVEAERDAQSRALRELIHLLDEHEQRMAELRARIADLEQLETAPTTDADQTRP